eukprot:8676682-Pyramimonas_sp.AAC.1
MGAMRLGVKRGEDIGRGRAGCGRGGEGWRGVTMRTTAPSKPVNCATPPTGIDQSKLRRTLSLPSREHMPPPPPTCTGLHRGREPFTQRGNDCIV